MDLILRNARLVDDPEYLVEIGIEGGKIAVIGPNLAAKGKTLDLGGRLVSPGFVDVHTHFDAQVFWDTTLSPSPFRCVAWAKSGSITT